MGWIWELIVLHLIGELMRKLKNVIQRLLNGIARSGLIRKLETAIRSIDNIQIPDIRNATREIQTAIRSMDAEWRSQVIQELDRVIRTLVEARKQELSRLGQAIQDLQNAIDAIKTKVEKRRPDLPMAEWWWNLKNVLDKLRKVIPSINEVRVPSRDNLPLDKISEVIAGLGVPGLVLVMLMAASPWVGAAAITSSLAALGPFGMLGGIATLGVLAFISRALAKFGFEKVFSAVLIELREDGKTCAEIREEVNRYPISKELKRKLRENIKRFYEEENHEQ